MTLQLKSGDTVALMACSDPIPQELRVQINELSGHLQQWGLQVVEASTLIDSHTEQEKANELNRLYADPHIKAIFDISGGDLANGILPYLNYEQIRTAGTAFFGMSDLTVVLNAIVQQSQIQTYHYQIMNIIKEHGAEQRQQFYRTFFEGGSDLYGFDFDFMQGENLHGDVIGGNIRCFLKLVGTPYFPKVAGKVILLESWSGRASRITSMLDQLHQIGVFNACSGLLLGTFTEIEQHGEWNRIQQHVLQLTAQHPIPIVKSKGIGHNSDSKCIIIS